MIDATVRVDTSIALDESVWDLGQSTGMPVFQALVMLIASLDSDGRFQWRPRRLKATCLPFWDGDFELLLAEMQTAGVVVREGDVGIVPERYLPTEPEYIVEPRQNGSAKRSVGSAMLRDRLAAYGAKSNLARQISVTPMLVHHWVKGNSKPSTAMRLAISQTLGIPFDAWDEEQETEQ